MTGGVSRRNVLGGLAAIGLTGTAQAQAPMVSRRPVARGSGLLRARQPDLASLIEKAKVSGHTGIAVMNVGTGEVLEAYQPTDLLPPASVTKAVTASYALDVLGPSHRFVTRVYATAPVTGGRIDGDIILAGGGDPSLDTTALASLVRGLRERYGLHEVSGRFLVWDGALPRRAAIDDSQPEQAGYNPALSGIILNYNRVHFEWKRTGKDYTITMQARSDGFRPAVETSRMRVEPRKAPVYTYEDKGTFDDWTVARDVLGKGGARWLPVRKPARYAADVFKTLARVNGIVLNKVGFVDELPGSLIEIGRVESAPLQDILQRMLKYSTNITAECVGLAATKARSGHVPTLVDSAAAMNAWAIERLGMTAPAFVDHSGLEGTNRVSAQDMVTGIASARRLVELKSLLKEHPLKDERRRIIKDSPVSVRAKTGTLNFTSGLSGFIDLPDGTELAFAIFSADMKRRAALTKAERERPPGGREYNRRARMLQQRLLSRWGILYSG